MTSVLIVDDSAALGELLTTTLTLAGHTAAWVATGAEALRRAGELSPDVMLIDLHLDDMAGDELAVRLREADIGARLLAMSGEVPDKEAALPFARVLLKPFSMRTLLEVLS